MRALLVLTLVILAAATALAYGHTDASAGLSSVMAQTTGAMRTEPIVLLLSGAALLAAGAALRRFSF